MMVAAGASRSTGKLTTGSTALFVCDIQERFRPIISGFPAIRGAGVLGLPVVVTEQYPERLGATVSELKEVLPEAAPVLAKTLFSMVTPAMEDFLSQNSAIRQVIICGIETHVCVMQTSLDLLDRGYEVHVLVDGASSQRPTDREAGLMRMAQSGAFLVSSEMALFQLMKDAKAPGFKEVSALVREPRPQDLLLPGLTARL
ncbi:Isochorismatase domain-containing protein 2 [Monoraphidium neglectum]|uniref:Isochorismatase domain-containing protein 2 n=1 Tax=Monoraphidium neglectum TaxID=145388 RepID=A0A0D2MJ15_9CHLO|nr:Isochorismatase domain-containing protein 2 [Monoraphidium neglectum]KIZ03005.1 Isochorismatase domain-containing protein 2 [Monoraphidium neglectum]|eukprot:XP_013902024.1 Isochorismatase domain-containing protein 2 [Monoraphidium neglectum]